MLCESIERRFVVGTGRAYSLFEFAARAKASRRTESDTSEGGIARDTQLRTGDPTKSKEDEMLVLSRKLNEKIVIDGGIVVTVVKIEGGQVRLGIDAPKNIKVFRQEILDGAGCESAKESLVPAGV